MAFQTVMQLRNGVAISLGMRLRLVRRCQILCTTRQMNNNSGRSSRFFVCLIRFSIRFDKTNKVTTKSSKMRRYDKNMSRIDLSLTDSKTVLRNKGVPAAGPQHCQSAVLSTGTTLFCMVYLCLSSSQLIQLRQYLIQHLFIGAVSFFQVAYVLSAAAAIADIEVRTGHARSLAAFASFQEVFSSCTFCHLLQGEFFQIA